MKILLDENFPIQLYRRLREAEYDAEHIIVLDQRGIPDPQIHRRLSAEELMFLTQDDEFESMPTDYRSMVIISRIPQSLPIKQRVQIWFDAIEAFLANKPDGKVFNLLETGIVVASQSVTSRHREPGEFGK